MEQQGQPTGSAGGTARRNNAFTDEQMAAAWQRVQTLHPAELLLVNAMRNGRLDRVADCKYTFTVESELIRDSINSHIVQVLSDLRDLLHNDDLSVELILDKETSSVNSMTDSEIYNIMRDNNKYIDVLARDLGMKLL